MVRDRDAAAIPAAEALPFRQAADGPRGLGRSALSDPAQASVPP